MKDVDYVVHAAALKQVPAAEYDPMEFVKTNIYGAENIIQASINQKVKKIIALSTDKAANPINLYGATKLASDKIFIAANNIVGSQKTRFSVVRYGNVLGSRGSVVPIFKNNIKKGKNYLPITDKNMTRFWITLEEGVNFVVKSFVRMVGGEIFVPKIPSIKIMDLAKAMKQNVKIKVIGVRPGEKIHELMCPRECSDFTFNFKDHYVIFSQINNSLSETKNNYFKNKIGEKGKKVVKDFEYSSNNNEDFLSIKKIQALNKNLE
jgi:UDP-N-acetylglucosamine 4,6-dehydratase